MASSPRTVEGLAIPLPRRQWDATARSHAGALVRAAYAPVDISVLVAFRVAFGAIMLWEVYRYFDHRWIERYWIIPPYTFPYAGFEWVRPWPGLGMYFHFVALGVLALFIAAGLWYRVSTLLFFLGFTYVFLLEKANYLNHFYFISLISFLLIFVPANRALSVDAALKPSLRSATAPAWTVWLLAFQVGVIYVFGGIAKINGDWLRGEPMRAWLSSETAFPLIGRWFGEEWMVYAFSYGGLLFDLLIVPALLWRRTRLPAFVLAIAFHLTNAELFSIGIFPWFALAASVLFFPPDLMRRAARRVRSSPIATAFAPLARPSAGPAAAPVARFAAPTRRQFLVVGLVALYAAVQIAVPLRHHLLPGNVAWTEEGHRFSWRMKLRDKYGEARFFATDTATGRVTEINPRHYLTQRQVNKMATQPDMIMQFAHHVERSLRSAGLGDQEIRAEAWVSLNGRPMQLMIDPTVDLTTVGHTIGPASWILPLVTDLPADDG